MPPLEKIVEEFAIRCAKGNNGGEWSTHYNNEQKEFWREFIRDLIRELSTKGTKTDDAPSR